MTSRDDELPSPVPPHALPLVDAFVDGLQAILGGDLIGIYLYGAMTFTDSADQIQDLDYHVIVREPLDDGRREAIDRLHGDLARDHPPLGGEMDGYYVTLAAARHAAPPRTQMWPLRRLPDDAAWPLHCAHIRSGHHIVLFGPDPSAIYPEPSWPELKAALYSEIRYVDDHLSDAPAYCVLNGCRLYYSFATRNVIVSKRGAADWARERLPEEWHGLIEAAIRSYQGRPEEQDETQLSAGVTPFIRMVWREIAGVDAADHQTP